MNIAPTQPNMLLHLCSKDSLKLHSGNKWNEFVVTLPRILYLNRNHNWEICLCDLSIKTRSREPISKVTRMYIYCDLIDCSYFKDSLRPVLGNVAFKSVKNDIFEIQNVHYVNVIQEQVDSIRIYLRLEDDSLPSLNDGTTRCTLHLRQK